MNRNSIFTSLALAALFSGILFFCVYQEWLIVSWHVPKNSFITSEQKTLERKTIKLTVWKQENWYQEESIVVWETNQKAQLKTLIAEWLTLAYEEKILEKKITIENVLLSPSGNDSYISFSDTLFEKKWSTYKKLHLIESLLKSIRENNIKIQKIFFLMKDQPLIDVDLDFSQAWPISGFLFQEKI